MRCYKSDFQRYNWIINNHTCYHHHHCNSIYNYGHQHCNNSIGFWGGFGAGLGNAVGNMLGGMFGNFGMTSWFGNTFGCFGMSGMFGNMSWMNPWTNLFGNMSWMNPWTNLLGNIKNDSCHCGCNDKKEPPTEAGQEKTKTQPPAETKTKTQTEPPAETKTETPVETKTEPPAETKTETKTETPAQADQEKLTTEVDDNNDASQSNNTITANGADFDQGNWANNNVNVSELNLGNLPEGYSTIDNEVTDFNNISKAIDQAEHINDVTQTSGSAIITKEKYEKTSYPLYIQITDKNNKYQYKCIGIYQENIPIYATPDSDDNDNIYALVYYKNKEKQVLLQFDGMPGYGSGDNQIKNKK